ncbi:hypothetical protein BKH46_01490 [Helicobacter sp. 12S02634-8]|uniref:TerC family protein n=1 Tax=Helicobacter sp. 12S02634-8 TaxID=1476199 RepID=UPI000BA53268|nr:TerC family protein [Helicobacter sp. 12S02634-8]PAF48013.1 hypothetical protein BKH46_01490 [Helicobacter sp. 12S02634-8]
MLEWLTDPSAWIALATLTLLEIVLGIDNIIFIAILVGKLPERQRDKARVLGLSLAMLTRIALLASLFWIMKLTSPLFEIKGNAISGRDLILILGGLFLIYKSTHEIHAQLNPKESHISHTKGASGFFSILLQIAILDIIFSLDSVITAVGMADHLPVMVIAIILAVLVMMAASKSISIFVEANPTIKTLALSFLLMVGIALVADGLDFHIPKGYIYFAMGFSLGVECINIYASKKNKQSS